MRTDFSIINHLITKFEQDLKEYDDIDVHVFPQLWGSTALGYGGIGGQAITSSHTIVLYAQHFNIARVYFGCERLGYEIVDPNSLFFEDLYKGRLEGCNRAGKYRRDTISSV